MGRRRYNGSITIFLSLTSILFLSLICAVVESARVQGAKTQAVNITGMGTYSVLGEFDNHLIEQYNIFSLDGTLGNGSFQISKVNDELNSFLSSNANPRKDIFTAGCFDPWNLELTDSKIEKYALLTDQKGEPFYQQAVAYMKANAAVIAVDKLLEYAKDVDRIEDSERLYESSQKKNDSQLSEMEKKQNEKMEQMESEAQESGTALVIPEAAKKNPLKEIAKLRKKSTLEIVTWDKKLSEKSVKTWGFPSRGVWKKGTMKTEKKEKGLIANVIFREYLMTHFPSFLSGVSGTVLDYQIEYILGGKKTDKKNLKYVVNRLLLIREGLNYLYCVDDPTISGQAESLAFALTGFLGIEPLTIATKHALLLAWAYGESLIDVRILLDNGKVPVFKDSSTWSLSLENLGNIVDILRRGAKGSGKGLKYSEYLRILLNMGSVVSQRMRALDMIQAELKEKNPDFKAENCIVGIHASAKWKCKPVFFSLPRVIMGAELGEITTIQESSMCY